MTTLFALGNLLFATGQLLAESSYIERLDDPKAVYLTADKFPVHGDGVTDDSDALQQAIDKVQETTNQGIVFVPSGRYRVTRTIYIWPGIRVIGYGVTRPVVVLRADTPAFQAGPSYMVFFAGGRPGHTGSSDHNGGGSKSVTPPDASPGTFYSAMSNVDIGESRADIRGRHFRR